MKYILFITAFIYFNSLAYSHPHLFIKSSSDFLIKDNFIKGIKISWTWDKWWSEDVINECDKNNDNLFDEKETQLIYEDFFIGIEDFNYFTEITINNKKIKIAGVKDFKAFINSDKIVTYIFVIPIEVKIEDEVKISLAFNDETIYTAFDKNVVLKNITGYAYKNLKITNYSYYGVKIDFTIAKNK
ncbi:MAG TPA: DUF1007 family protein [Spirochaetota bacterium]|nr:DUF1007 family protein [Spirochaetota bacterium]HOS34084.1 DUF1007 family protein [Spirochaetota bacterium]HOS55925.1 DUF1007 family protein [Spirochaetota bacterium]HPK62387.1 DUF1007 family protein [Spirochaetota bacterium]HQF77965.1 DUF1007 family protein [Spirochaetota bacterium]